jgi:hypothetical protein
MAGLVTWDGQFPSCLSISRRQSALPSSCMRITTGPPHGFSLWWRAWSICSAARVYRPPDHGRSSLDWRQSSGTRFRLHADRPAAFLLVGAGRFPHGSLHYGPDSDDAAARRSTCGAHGADDTRTRNPERAEAGQDHSTSRREPPRQPFARQRVDASADAMAMPADPRSLGHTIKRSHADIAQISRQVSPAVP